MESLLSFLDQLSVNTDWTLFLDRDGVINERLPDDYVVRPEQFVFRDGALSAVAELSGIFGHVFVVTNQRGIALGRMTEQDLMAVHQLMVQEIEEGGGRIDGVYYCPHGREEGCDCRKPGIGLALQAQEAFPEVDFSCSVLLGDSISDLQMGKKLGMVTVWVEGKGEEVPAELFDFRIAGFESFS